MVPAASSQCHHGGVTTNPPSTGRDLRAALEGAPRLGDDLAAEIDTIRALLYDPSTGRPALAGRDDDGAT